MKDRWKIWETQFAQQCNKAASANTTVAKTSVLVLLGKRSCKSEIPSQTPTLHTNHLLLY